MKNRSARAAAIDFTVSYPLWNYVPDGFRQNGLPALKGNVCVNVLFSGFDEYSREVFRCVSSCVQFLACGDERNDADVKSKADARNEEDVRNEAGVKNEADGRNEARGLAPFAIDYFAFCDEETADVAEEEFCRGFYRYREFLSGVGGKENEYLPIAPTPFSFSFVRGKRRSGVVEKLRRISEIGKSSLNIVVIGNGNVEDDGADERAVREAAEKLSDRSCDSDRSGDSGDFSAAADGFTEASGDFTKADFRTVVFRLSDGRWKCAFDSFAADAAEGCAENVNSWGYRSVNGISGSGESGGALEPLDEEFGRVRRFAAYRNALYVKEKQSREGKFVPFEEILGKTLDEKIDMFGRDMQSVCAFSGLVFYCSALGFDVVKDENPKKRRKNETAAIGKSAFAALRDIFVTCEHYRWNACMIVNGYVPANKDEILNGIATVDGAKVYTNGTDKQAGKHGNLTTFSGLELFADMISERDGVPVRKVEVKTFDAQLIDNADELFAFSGLKIVRRAR